MTNSFHEKACKMPRSELIEALRVALETRDNALAVLLEIASQDLTGPGIDPEWPKRMALDALENAGVRP